MVAFGHIESVTSCHLNKHRLNRICTTPPLHPTNDERRKQDKKVQMCSLFLQIPDISLLFLAALWNGKMRILLQAETCDEAQNKKELQTKQ